MLLEPIMLVTLSVPEDSVGDVIGDLNSRRGRPLGMEPVGGMTEIKAEVPMAEMLTYAPDLRSITGGQGEYTMEFARYEEVPATSRRRSSRRRVRGGRDGLVAAEVADDASPGAIGRCYARRRMTPREIRTDHDRSSVRRLRAYAVARREPDALPARRPAPRRVRAVHRPGRARGLDPRGARASRSAPAPPAIAAGSICALALVAALAAAARARARGPSPTARWPRSRRASPHAADELFAAPRHRASATSTPSPPRTS